MLKLILGILALIYVLLLLYFALRELGEEPQISPAPDDGECHKTSRLAGDRAITGYMEKSLLETILREVERLIGATRPRMVFVGEANAETFPANLPPSIGDIYILYKTTSRDYVEQVINGIVDYLKGKGIRVKILRLSTPRKNAYYYIFLSIC